ncbi:IclR family transcriptional regulator [Ruegeria halocynthiae]|uniref:IclR family transcriptional regulator n=1 Tax=Ruegeria halocynthiae TaxID=985054 RepID=UPI000691046F|nr:IclR family transcriptional regulator [Ruegeria halocynthiae]
MGTAQNALKLLDLFSITQPEIGLSQIARLTGTNKATALRHLRALEASGLIEQNPATKSYAIGPAALRLAALRKIAVPGLEGARLRMQVAMHEVGESLHLSFLENGALKTALLVETTQHSVRVSLDPSAIIPINATASGLSILSFGPASLLQQLDQDNLPSYTEQTIIDPNTLQKRIKQTLQRGWSDISSGYELGVHGFAAPVFGIDRVAIGTIAFAVPENRATDAGRPALLQALHTLSGDLTAEFGGQNPEDFPTQFYP